MSFRHYAIMFTVAAILISTCLVGCGPAQMAPTASWATAAEKTPLKEHMRLIPGEAPQAYLREFLICGPFIETEALSAKDGDFLAAIGGEAAARPTEGQAVGGLVWRKYSSVPNTVDFGKDFVLPAGKKAVAYAFATVKWAEQGPAAIYLRSSAEVKVYCNGRAVPGTENVRRAGMVGVVLPVKLVSGDNLLLVRIDGSGGRWNYVMSVGPKWQIATDWRPMMPMVSATGDGMEILTDASAMADGSPVKVDVLAPGGVVKASRDAERGDTVNLDTAGWADGPYELRIVATNPDGTLQTSYQPWYKGAWLNQITAMLDECDKLPKDSDDLIVLRKVMLGERVLAVFGRDPRKPAPEPGKEKKPGMVELFGAMMEFAELRDPETAWSGKGGFVRLAWRDDVDGSAQFARVYLPMGYDKEKKYPLFVSLHGYNATNPPYATFGDQSSRHRPLADKYQIIWMEPHGRGNTSYRGIGEMDVMKAVSEATKRLSVDSERVYLTGQSMGGGGTWHVGTRHTDVFAAIAPVYGGWDWHANMKEEDAAKMVPLRRAMEEQDSSIAQAECLLDTPVFVHHGDSDTTVPVEGSRYAVKTLQRWGYDVRYQEHPGKGHTNGLFADEDIVKWALRYTLVRNPRHVRLRAFSLFGATSRWVTAEQQENPFEPMYVDAVVVDPCTIQVTSQNVLQLRLNPGEKLVPGDKKGVKVVWNGQLVEKPEITHRGAIILKAADYKPGTLVKKRMGPASFAIVVGTASTDERMKKFVELAGQQLLAGWVNWQHTQPRFFKDTEITDEQIVKYSLILFGGPNENLVTRKLIKDIPLQMTPESVTIAGKEFKVSDAAVAMRYPHPLNKSRLVTVYAGNSASGFFLTNRMPDIDDSGPDFAIYDGRAGADNDDKTAVAWGRFDYNWKYDQRYTNMGDAELMAKLAKRKAPTAMSAASDAKTLMLSDVLETTSIGSFGMMGRDLNWKGMPIKLGGKVHASGISVMPWDRPCKATYDLAGGNWKRLKATIGIEIEKKVSEIEPLEKTDTKNLFIVTGDGKELYRSPVLEWNSGPIDIDVDVTGVKVLELSVTKQGRWHNLATSMDWAELRLEK